MPHKQSDTEHASTVSPSVMVYVTTSIPLDQRNAIDKLTANRSEWLREAVQQRLEREAPTT